MVITDLGPKRKCFLVTDTSWHRPTSPGITQEVGLTVILRSLIPQNFNSTSFFHLYIVRNIVCPSLNPGIGFCRLCHHFSFGDHRAKYLWDDSCLSQIILYFEYIFFSPAHKVLVHLALNDLRMSNYKPVSWTRAPHISWYRRKDFKTTVAKETATLEIRMFLNILGTGSKLHSNPAPRKGHPWEDPLLPTSNPSSIEVFTRQCALIKESLIRRWTTSEEFRHKSHTALPLGIDAVLMTIKQPHLLKYTRYTRLPKFIMSKSQNNTSRKVLR